ncbi:MAG: fructosamine kinase family protein [Mariprofundaceae bacterium]
MSISASLWQAIEASIRTTISQPFNIEFKRPISGGNINQAYRIEDGSQVYFVKINHVNLLPMFEAEADGLRELTAAKAIRIPQVMTLGSNDSKSWLVTEYINLGGKSSNTDALFGQSFAGLHRFTAEKFGWFRDNTIGSTPQINTQESDWLRFYCQHRLGFQLKLAAQHGFTGSLQTKGERLLADMDQFFKHQPQASLLHGDLWGGNWGADESGSPVIFDPAVYYGDREADLAMTELFGGFSKTFYDAYQEAWPLDEGYKVRKTLYNLYHILNHANLFGGVYAGQAEGMMDQLLSELG